MSISNPLVKTDPRTAAGTIAQQNRVFYEAYQRDQISKEEYETAMAFQREQQAKQETQPATSPRTNVYIESIEFYDTIGKPDFGGVYAAPTIPEGYSVVDVKETDVKAVNPLAPVHVGTKQLEFTLAPTAQPRPPSDPAFAPLGSNIFARTANPFGTAPLVNTPTKAALLTTIIAAPILAPAAAGALGIGGVTSGGVILGELAGVGVSEVFKVATTGEHLTVGEGMEGAALGGVLSPIGLGANQALGLTGHGVKSVLGRVATNTVIGTGSGAVVEYAKTGTVTAEGLAMGAAFGAGLGLAGEVVNVGVGKVRSKGTDVLSQSWRKQAEANQRLAVADDWDPMLTESKYQSWKPASFTERFYTNMGLKPRTPAPAVNEARVPFGKFEYEGGLIPNKAMGSSQARGKAAEDLFDFSLTTPKGGMKMSAADLPVMEDPIAVKPINPMIGGALTPNEKELRTNAIIKEAMRLDLEDELALRKSDVVNGRGPPRSLLDDGSPTPLSFKRPHAWEQIAKYVENQDKHRGPMKNIFTAPKVETDTGLSNVGKGAATILQDMNAAAKTTKTTGGPTVAKTELIQATNPPMTFTFTGTSGPSLVNANPFTRRVANPFVRSRINVAESEQVFISYPTKGLTSPKELLLETKAKSVLEGMIGQGVLGDTMINVGQAEGVGAISGTKADTKQIVDQALDIGVIQKPIETPKSPSFDIPRARNVKGAFGIPSLDIGKLSGLSKGGLIRRRGYGRTRRLYPIVTGEQFLGLEATKGLLSKSPSKTLTKRKAKRK